MLKKINKNLYKIILIITIIITIIPLFYFIDKKQGFHEDEMFSYGSSNYQSDNVFSIDTNISSFHKAFDEQTKADNIFEKIGKSIQIFI